MILLSTCGIFLSTWSLDDAYGAKGIATIPIRAKNEVVGRYVAVTKESFWKTDGSRKDDTLYILDTKTGEYRILY